MKNQSTEKVLSKSQSRYKGEGTQLIERQDSKKDSENIHDTQENLSNRNETEINLLFRSKETMKSKESIAKGFVSEGKKERLINPLEAQTAANQQVFLPGIPESHRYNPNHSIQNSGGDFTDDEGPGGNSRFQIRNSTLEPEQDLKMAEIKNRKLAGIMATSSHMFTSPQKKLKHTVSSMAGGSANLSSMNLGEDDEEMEEEAGIGHFSGAEAGKLTQYSSNKENLRRVFMEHYGVEINFPAYYYVGAQFVPQHPNMIITMAFHIIPRGDQQTVQTTQLDGSFEEASFMDIYQQTGENLIINLLEDHGRKGFTTLKKAFLSGVNKAITCFSSDGRFFAVYNKTGNTLLVYDSSNIEECFEAISNNKVLFSHQINKEKFGKCKDIVIDPHSRYLAIYSQTQAHVFSLEPNSEGTYGDLLQKYKLDTDTYHGIYDLNLHSAHTHGDDGEDNCKNAGFLSPRSVKSHPGDMNDSSYKCLVACKRLGVTSIDIFDVSDPSDSRTISYAENSDKLQVQISEDNSSVIFSTDKEHFVHDGRTQKFLTQIKEKKLRSSIFHEGEFIMIATSDYDRDIDILTTRDPKFNANILRSIEPGQLHIYDRTVVKEEGSNRLKILSLLGDALYMDVIDLDAGKRGEEEDSHVAVTVERNYYSYSFNWPYFSYATKNKTVFIFNAFNPTFIQRYVLPKNIVKVVASFLTDTHDYFCLVETEDDHFEVMHIDLDSLTPVFNGPVLRYPFSQVDGKKVKGFHTRGSSEKEHVNLNKVLHFVILHQDDLYAWNGDELELVGTSITNLYYMSDDQVYYLQTEPTEVNGREVLHSSVFTLDIQFATYETQKIYEDSNPRAEILNFGVDNTRKRLLILTGIKNKKNKRDKFITVYDVEGDKIVFRVQTKNRELIGRLKTNLYNFVEGHIYYGNSVVKIRYDLIKFQQKNNIEEELQEHQLFDYYHDVLHLKKESQQIQSGTPLQTCVYNKLAYIIFNKKDLRPRKLLVMPYLHDRRIYLNRRHKDDQYYTILEHEGANYIVCFSFTYDKFYVYTETGILIHRIEYPDIARACGKPVTISEDGQIMLFRKNHLATDIFVVRVTIEGLQILRKISLLQEIRAYLDSELAVTHLGQSQLSKVKHFWQVYLKECGKLRDIQVSMSLNDQGDALIGIAPKKDYLAKLQVEVQELGAFEGREIQSKDTLLSCQLFFYLSNQPQNKDFMYFHDDREEVGAVSNLKGLSMNDQFIFFYNLGHVWKLNLTTRQIDELSLYISEDETQTWIRGVRTGSNKEVVGIRVRQTAKSDCMIIWNLPRDLEVDSFDIDGNALFFQDGNGHPYVVEKNYIINCTQKCKLKCYRLRVSDFNTENLKFGFKTGHRVERRTQNWMIFRNFINLSHSYMTFVIKDHFDKEGYLMEDYAFDVEGYDFILDRRTIFTEDHGALVNEDFEKLNFILENYERLDPSLLHSLHYKCYDRPPQVKQTKSKSLRGPSEKWKVPLHFAVEANNFRTVNILLAYMAKIDYSSTEVIQDIFPDLINYQNFIDYLEKCPFQTVQMLQKQSMKLYMERPEDTSILVTAPNQTSYIDNVFFQESMYEVPDELNSLTYSVNVHSIKADWIINHQNGLVFLNEILKQENLEVFATPYIEIVIQFLYEQFRTKILQVLLPPYILQLISIQAIVILSDYLRDHELHIDDEDKVEDENWTDRKNVLESYVSIALVVALIVNIFNTVTIVRATMHLGMKVFRRFWSFVDLIIILCVYFLAFQLLNVDYTNLTLRGIEAILIIFIWFKSIYFLRLHSEIAPLVDMIIIILGDVKYFMVIFVVALLGFVQGFFLIGKNQRDLIEDGKEEGDASSYASAYKAFEHVYLSALGEFDVGAYFGSAMTPVFVILFVGLSFFMCILMLNMLIAIMGDTFNQETETKEAKQKMSQLAFIVDNWWINPVKNKERIVFIVAAFQTDD